MKKFATLCVALMLGCSVNFDYGNCVTSCQKCNIQECENLCAQLEAGENSPECHSSADAVWVCAIHEQCNFTTACSPQINTFLQCTP